MKHKSLLQRAKDTIIQKFCNKEVVSDRNELIIEEGTAPKHNGLAQVAEKHKKLAEQNQSHFLTDVKQENTTANSQSTSHGTSE